MYVHALTQHETTNFVPTAGIQPPTHMLHTINSFCHYSFPVAYVKPICYTDRGLLGLFALLWHAYCGPSYFGNFYYGPSYCGPSYCGTSHQYCYGFPLCQSIDSLLCSYYHIPIIVESLHYPIPSCPIVSHRVPSRPSLSCPILSPTTK